MGYSQHTYHIMQTHCLTHAHMQIRIQLNVSQLYKLKNAHNPWCNKSTLDTNK